MPPRHRTTLLLSLAMLFFAAGPVWFALSRRPQVAEFPDGTTLTLVRQTLGTSHRYGGSAFSGLTGSLHPSIVPAWMRWEPAGMESASPSVGIWFLEEEGPKSVRLRWEIVDRQGNAVTTRRSLSSGNWKRPGQSLLGLRLDAWPRRDDWFLVRAWPEGPDGAKAGGPAEFRVTNLARRTKGTPAWNPPPLPVVQTAGDLEIELIRLVAGTALDSSRVRPLSPDEEPAVTAGFRVRERGEPTNLWFADGVELRDATGNEMRQSSWSHYQGENDTTWISWTPGLWPDPGGWKARFEFTREPGDAPFSDAERIVLEDVVLPTGHGITAMNETFSRLGHTIRILQLEGRPAGTHTPFQLQLRAEASPPLMDNQLDFVKAIDDQGRPANSSGGGWSRPAGTYQFQFEPPPDAKTLTITLAVHASVFVEFHAMPEVLAGDGIP